MVKEGERKRYVEGGGGGIVVKGVRRKNIRAMNMKHCFQFLIASIIR